MAGLLSGIAAGLEFYAKESQANREKERDLELMRQKMLMANQLEMDLLKQKQAFAQQYPQYEHFEKTPLGVVVGFDKQGGARELYHPDAENAQAYKDQYQMTQLYKDRLGQAATSNAAVNAALVGPRTASMNAAAGASTRNADTNARGAAVREAEAPAITAQRIAAAARDIQAAAEAKLKNDPQAQLPSMTPGGKPLDAGYINIMRSDDSPDSQNLVKAYDAATAYRQQIQAAAERQIQALYQGGSPGIVAPTGASAEPAGPVPDPFAGY